ncbi:MAG: hypothetical protein H6Q20_706 [Bacteroidetes bacterium]|jgi:tetratricopeptide (TPR) repeat protein|nr:hypothetical protein [Bacteroidota bacterium]
MTHEEFYSIVNNPQSVSAGHIAGLKELAEYYPYFAFPRILLAKAVADSRHVHSERYAAQAALHAPDRRWLYYYLYPELKLSAGVLKTERVPKYSGNYFDLLNAVENEGGDTRQSLKNLAERLKAARQMVTQNNQKPAIVNADNKVSDNAKLQHQTTDFSMPDVLPESKITEDLAKKLIKDKKYAEAIEVLNKLILINPKKSIYFADQIRFLEKIHVNSKK